MRKLSYSRLAKFDRGGPKALLEERKDSEALTFGSLVDDMLTSPGEVDKKYYFANIKPLTASIKDLAERLESDSEAVFIKVGKLYYNDAKIAEIAKEMGLWKSMKDPEKLKAKWHDKQVEEYLFHKLNSRGKTVIDSEMATLARRIVEVFRTNENTKYFLKERDGTELKFQLKLDFRKDGKVFTTRLDVLHIDHDAKTVTPIDIKTGSEPILNFKKSWYKYRYDIQFSMYSMAAKAYVETEYPEYSLENMIYIYVYKNDPEHPVVFTFDTDWVKAAYEGYGYRKGWKTLAEEVTWHYENNVFDYPKSVYDIGSIHIGFGND